MWNSIWYSKLCNNGPGPGPLPAPILGPGSGPGPSGPAGRIIKSGGRIIAHLRVCYPNNKYVLLWIYIKTNKYYFFSRMSYGNVIMCSFDTNWRCLLCFSDVPAESLHEHRYAAGLSLGLHQIPSCQISCRAQRSIRDPYEDYMHVSRDSN